MNSPACQVELQQRLVAEVPVTFTAAGQPDEPRVRCVRSHLAESDCHQVLVAEFLVEVPVHLSVTALCEHQDEPESAAVTCMASGLFRVELPLHTVVENNADSAGRIFLSEVARCSCVAVRKLEVALPLHFTAEAACDGARVRC